MSSALRASDGQASRQDRFAGPGPGAAAGSLQQQSKAGQGRATTIQAGTSRCACLYYNKQRISHFRALNIRKCLQRNAGVCVTSTSPTPPALARHRSGLAWSGLPLVLCMLQALVIHQSVVLTSTSGTPCVMPSFSLSQPAFPAVAPCTTPWPFM